MTFTERRGNSDVLGKLSIVVDDPLARRRG